MNPTAISAPIRIAVLDDHQLFRQGLAQLLRALPYVEGVAEAATLPELRAALAPRLPDVVLLDLEMPGADGMEATKQLLAEHPELRIVVVSMHFTSHFVYHLMKLGARGYLPKDADREQLREAIEAVVTSGYHFTPAVSAALAQGARSSPRAKPTFQPLSTPLTPREREVLALLCAGRTTGEIAAQLFISGRTVEGHRKNLLEKTNTPNAVALAMHALKHGLLDEP